MIELLPRAASLSCLAGIHAVQRLFIVTPRLPLSGAPLFIFRDAPTILQRFAPCFQRISCGRRPIVYHVRQSSIANVDGILHARNIYSGRGFYFLLLRENRRHDKNCTRSCKRFDHISFHVLLAFQKNIKQSVLQLTASWIDIDTDGEVLLTAVLSNPLPGLGRNDFRVVRS